MLERKLITTDHDFSFSAHSIITAFKNLNGDIKSASLFKSTYTSSVILNSLNKAFNANLNKKHYQKKI